MLVEWDGKVSAFNDGFGLCSATRWHPSVRGLQLDGHQQAFISCLRKVVLKHVRKIFPDVPKAMMSLALGKFQLQPFSDSQLSELRANWFALLANPGTASTLPAYQPFYLHAMV